MGARNKTPLRETSTQRGQAFLIVVVILVIGSVAAIYTLIPSSRPSIEADKKTAEALAQARDALIGHAVSHSSRPGALPCPDTTNDGTGESPTASPGGNSCPSYIGRLPWKSLGLPDLRDSSGERLWYLLSPNFRNANPPAGPVLNSDTLGQISITGHSNQIIAVIISAGSALASQDRDPLDNAKLNNPDNFLEGGNQTSGTSFTLTAGNGINDLFMPITHETLLPKVEIRVAQDIKRLLQNYYDLPSNTAPSYRNYYPFAAPLTGTTACVEGVYRGRIPTSPCSPLNSLAATLPPWFGPTGTGNRWNEIIIYSVSPRCTPRLNTVPDLAATPLYYLFNPPSGLFCQAITIFGIPLLQCYPYTQVVDSTSTSCQNNSAGPMLTVNGSPAEAILLTAGRGLTGQTRPCSRIAACLEDQENHDGPAGYPANVNVDGSDNFIYVNPQRSAANNDTIFIVRPSP